MSDLKIDELIATAHSEGFRGDNAAAKVCQDLILKAISKSRLSRNVTIKGGVVMRFLSGSARRATLDIDIDFLHYPIEDSAIDAFIEDLNCLTGVTFSRFGTIEELNQQDY